MALTPDDIDEAYIASSRALAITGTHLSHPNTRAAVLKALEYARRHGLRTAPTSITARCCGADVAGRRRNPLCGIGPVTRELQEVLHHFDLIVGTEEEFHIAGGSTDTLTALKTCGGPRRHAGVQARRAGLLGVRRRNRRRLGAGEAARRRAG